MAIVLQASTLSGKVIENGRWRVTFESGLQENQSIALNLSIPEKEVGLINYLTRSPSTEVMLDKTDEGYNVAVSCRVARIRHMVETKDGSVESMAMLTPANRLAEIVMTYLLAPQLCDPKFVRAVKDSS